MTLFYNDILKNVKVMSYGTRSFLLTKFIRRRPPNQNPGYASGCKSTSYCVTSSIRLNTDYTASTYHRRILHVYGTYIPDIKNQSRILVTVTYDFRYGRHVRERARASESDRAFEPARAPEPAQASELDAQNFDKFRQ